MRASVLVIPFWSLIGPLGCVGPLGWENDPPWLTPRMSEGELASELAEHVPLGATRDDVLKRLGLQGVRPLDALRADDGSWRMRVVAMDGRSTPQFAIEGESAHPRPVLDHNYYVEREDRVAVVMTSYRAKPPRFPAITVSWAEPIASEILIDFKDDRVHSVLCRPLGVGDSREQGPSFEIKSLR